MHLNAIIQRDELSDGSEMFLATCPELDVVSQGETPDEARANCVKPTKTCCKSPTMPK